MREKWTFLEVKKKKEENNLFPGNAKPHKNNDEGMALKKLVGRRDPPSLCPFLLKCHGECPVKSR